MTDDLESFIRDAKPGTAHRTDPVPEAGLVLLQSIRAAKPQHAPSPGRLERSAHRRRSLRRSRVSLAAGTAAAVFVIFAVMVNVLHTLTPAVAVTPEPLRTTAVSESVREIAEELSHVRASYPDGSDKADSIRLSEWSLNTQINEDGEIESSAIEPQWREITFNSDGTTHLRLVAGEPFAGQDSSSFPEPGTILEDTTYDASNPFDADGVYDAELPTDSALVGDYLASTLGSENPTSAEYFDAITGVLSNRLITKEQEAALLKFVATLNDVDVDGGTIDRLDRRGIVFRVADGDYARILVLSPESGQFLAAETIYIGSTRTDIASPAVTSYIAWER